MALTHERGVLDTNTVIMLSRLTDHTLLPAEPLITAVTLAELSVGPLVAATDTERAARQAHLQQAEADLSSRRANHARRMECAAARLPDRAVARPSREVRLGRSIIGRIKRTVNTDVEPDPLVVAHRERKRVQCEAVAEGFPPFANDGSWACDGERPHDGRQSARAEVRLDGKDDRVSRTGAGPVVAMPGVRSSISWPTRCTR